MDPHWFGSTTVTLGDKDEFYFISHPSDIKFRLDQEVAGGRLFESHNHVDSWVCYLLFSFSL